jgi:chromosome segregation protein
LGLIRSLIEVEKGWEQVVDAYLEGVCSGIVMRDFESIAEIGRKLKSSEKLCLLSAEVSPTKNKSYVPEATALSLVVKPRDSRVKGLVSNLFENVYFVQSGAEKLVKKYQNCTFIDREFNIYSSKGCIILPKEKKKKFSVSQEIENLKKEIKSLEQEEQKLLADYNADNENLANLKEQERQIGEKIQKLTKELYSVDSEIRSLNQTVSQIKKRIKELTEKLERSKAGVESFSSRTEVLKEKLSKLKEERSKLVESLKNYEKEGEKIRAKKEEVQKEVNQIFAKLSVLREKVNSGRKLIEEKKKFLGLLETRIENSKRKVETLRKEISIREKEISKLEEMIETVIETLEDVREEVESLEERKKELENLISEKEHQLKEFRKERDSLREKVKNTELELAKVNANYNELVRKLTDLNETPSRAIEIAEGEDSEERVKKELFLVKEKISKLGSINMLAIDEYSKLLERYNELKSQEEDLLNTIKELNEAISRLNSEMEKRILKTFRAVNKEFKKIFKVVFGGGNARLILTGKNPIEGGVEIEAKPPGKKHSGINLLSGGERTLVALTFLYSLYAVRPAPFLVLDEVDAALDDANTVRFVELLKQMAEKSQVIVITHNKITMESADTIYGITMEVPGISKVVGVSFEVHKELPAYTEAVWKG